jgi:hypothetical protein
MFNVISQNSKSRIRNIEGGDIIKTLIKIYL